MVIFLENRLADCPPLTRLKPKIALGGLTTAGVQYRQRVNWTALLRACKVFSDFEVGDSWTVRIQAETYVVSSKWTQLWVSIRFTPICSPCL